MTRSAIVLLSGGLDSATTLAHALDEGFECFPITFRYGQRHALEIEAAARVARSLGVPEPIRIDLDLRAVGGSALTADLEVPRDRDEVEIGTGIPITYVPARNTLFLAFALAHAEVRGARDIFIGANVVDYSGYPDCRPEFLTAFERTANLGTRLGVESGGEHFRVRAPLIELTKGEIIRRGLELGVDYSLTLSCYSPDEDGRACGRCDACRLRLKGFAEAGQPDPAPYREGAAGPSVP
ncbi:MAG: 7-cyano-7-deazaguanine synthase QueC [Planctomycetota bacterium]